MMKTIRLKKILSIILSATTVFTSGCLASFTQQDAFALTAEPTEDSLFYEHYRYLNNPDYFYSEEDQNKNAIFYKIDTQTYDLGHYMSTDKNQIQLSEFKHNLEKMDYIKQLMEVISGETKIEDDLGKEVAMKYLEDIAKNKDIQKKIESFDDAKKTYEIFKNIDTFVKRDENFGDNAAEKYPELAKNISRMLSECGINISDSWITDLLKTLGSDKLHHAIKGMGKIIDYSKIFMYVLEVTSIDSYYINKAQSLINKDSTLYHDLNLIRMENQDPDVAFVLKIVDKEVFDDMGGDIIKLTFEKFVSSYSFAVARVVTKGVAKKMSTPDIDDIYKMVVSIVNELTLEDALEKYQGVIEANNKKGVCNPLDQQNYSFLMNLYLVSANDAVDRTKTVAKGVIKYGKKSSGKTKKYYDNVKKKYNRLNSTYKDCKSKLTYKKYIKSCLEHAKKDYKEPSISKSSVSISVNSSTILTVSGISNSDIVEWSSSLPQVANVQQDSSDASKATITGYTEGSCIISCTVTGTEDANGNRPVKKLDCNVNVKPLSSNSGTLNVSSVKLDDSNKNKPVRISILGDFDKDSTTWSLDNSAYVSMTVSKSKRYVELLAKKTGTGVLTCQIGGQILTCDYVVKLRPEIAVTVKVGETKDFAYQIVSQKLGIVGRYSLVTLMEPNGVAEINKFTVTGIQKGTIKLQYAVSGYDANGKRKTYNFYFVVRVK